MTTSNQAFIRAFSHAEPPTDLPEGPTREPQTGLPFAPHAELSDQVDHASSDARIEPSSVGRVDDEPISSMPRPHVQFPPTIRLDVANRRHTRLTSTNEVRHESNRRPLSDFATPTKKALFRPALEVDQFRWPQVCSQIASDAGTRLDALVEQIVLGAAQGRSVIVVVGNRPGVGCTTGVLCLAARLGAWGTRVALVDVSFSDPVLAKRLGLAVPCGWEDVFSGDIPFSDAVVASIADRAALLPIRSKTVSEDVADHICSIPAAVGIDVLRENFDVTFLDAGSSTTSENGTPRIVRFAARVGAEGVVAVRSADANETETDPKIEDQLAAAGIPTIGTITNFSQRATG